MNIKYITCSDPRNHNSLDDLFGLWQISDRVELAVQMHAGKVSPETDRYKWVRALVDRLTDDMCPYNFAMHINGEWCHSVCNGKIPDALKEFFDTQYKFNHIPMPTVRRIQLNMPRETATTLNPYVLKGLIESFPTQQFIIQYNDKTKDAVKKLNETGTQFAALYDASGGNGISPDAWRGPVFDSGATGYSGGMSPENVADNLTKISAVVPANRDIWIDAEGKLKTDNKFDIARARQYIQNAESWIAQNGKQR